VKVPNILATDEGMLVIFAARYLPPKWGGGIGY
jgi:hypothetical protein